MDTSKVEYSSFVTWNFSITFGTAGTIVMVPKLLYENSLDISFEHQEKWRKLEARD